MPEDAEPKKSSRLVAALRGFIATLIAGSIPFFYSETLFWGRPGRAPIGELILTWVIYSLLTYATLAVVITYRVRRASAVFLAGAFYGWLSEGVLVQTTYDALPLQLSWTGLAWHALLSIGLGWFALSAALQKSAAYSVLLSSLLGAFWGFWAVMWWQPEEGGRVTSPSSFASHAFSVGILLLLAFAVLPRIVPSQGFRSRGGRRFAAIVIGVWFLFVAVPARPIALIIAPLLFSVTLAALRRNAHNEQQETPQTLEELPIILRSAPPFRYLTLLAMPLSAVLVYAAFLQSGRIFATNMPVYYVTMPLGFLLYAWSIWDIRRKSSAK